MLRRMTRNGGPVGFVTRVGLVTRGARGAALLLPAVLLAATVFGSTVFSSTASADGLAGKGSIGGAIGVMRYLSNPDFKDGSSTRPTFRAMARYAWENHFTSTLEAGYGWNSRGEGGDYRGPDTTGTLMVVTPITFGLDYRIQGANPKLLPHVGVGIGAYPFTIRSGRERISKDRVNYNPRRHTAPGGYGKVGLEFLALPSMVLNADVLYHYVAMSDATKYPGGYFDKSVSFAEVRVGMSYYFTIRSTGPNPTGKKEDSEDKE